MEKLQEMQRQFARQVKNNHALLLVGDTLDISSILTDFFAKAKLSAGHIIRLPETEDKLKIEEIRQTLKKISAKPIVNQNIYIVIDATSINWQAAPALLKTLEEPPTYARFILTAPTASSVISTIKSRCQVFHCKGEMSKVNAPSNQITLEEIIKFPLKKRFDQAEKLAKLDFKTYLPGWIDESRNKYSTLLPEIVELLHDFSSTQINKRLHLEKFMYKLEA